MIESISVIKLTNAIMKEHPYWNPESVRKLAEDWVCNWDKRLEKPVSDYLETGVEGDFQFGEFSLFLIKAMRHNCGYLTAVELMDEYIKDPLNGKARILSRTMR